MGINNNKEKVKIKLKGKLRTYLQWPIILSLLLVAMNACVYTVSSQAGLLVTAFILVYILVVALLYMYNRPVILHELISFASSYGEIQEKLINDLTTPYALLDSTGKVVWFNKKFGELVKKDRDYQKSITGLFSSVTRDILPKGEEEKELKIMYGERYFKIKLHRISLNHVLQDNTMLSDEEGNQYLTAMYLTDETEMNQFIQEKNNEQLVAGLIYLDNYEEALASVEEVRRSLLLALVDRKINKHFADVDGIVRKMEKDRYFVVVKQKALIEMQSARFPLLEDVKAVNIGNDMAVTLSMGWGMNGDGYMINYEYARTSIDLALGRGGDQSVVKNREDISYYGGKSQQVEKNTRVKARVKAHALRELMESKENIIVMGHKIGDVDSFGASVGIYRAAKTLNKKVHIVINDITTSVRPLIDFFRDNPEYEKDLFLTSKEAEDYVDQNTVLVVVDVNRPSLTEGTSLLNMTNTIVVLDHHRQTNEVIENAVLSYIEPYASSTCEMVAEVLQYFDDSIRIRNEEADCLYAGVIIDTNNFMSKTGVRTFEAAAFLRRNGADVIRVRKMFRNDMADYKARAEAVRHAEIYRGMYAISICPHEGLESPTIVGAQAANELLNIIGVKASFILTEFHNKIYLSARSIDEVNVQIVVERFGGGGHMSTAGAQFVDCSIEDAKNIIMSTLDQMMEEGAI